MTIFLFVVAVLFLSAAHYCKALRWKQFIEVYEKPQISTLTSSLSIGYVISFCLPFRVFGDIARAIISGRKMKNGISFSFSTIVLDRYLDFIVTAVIFTVLCFSSFNNNVILQNTIFYLVCAIILIFLSFITLKSSKLPKLAIRKASSVFNAKIELNLLLFFWSFISSFKDMFRKLSRKKLVGYTIVMWLLYLSSYFTFAAAATNLIKINISLSDMILLLFSKDSLYNSIVSMMFKSPMRNLSILFAIYILSALVILIVFSVLSHKRGKNSSPIKRIHLLPQIDENARLNFLKLYFSNDNKEYLLNYLNMNRDINVVKDYSAGSNATTILCMDGKTTFFRKYAFGSDADKLYEQIEWMHEEESSLPLALILNEKRQDGYCCYDMEYKKNAMGLFEYVHCVCIKKGWQMIETVLDTLNSKLHSKNISKAEPEILIKYIDSKAIGNIEKIKKSKQIQPLLEFNEIIINGISYKNLCFFEKYLTMDYLKDVFKNDVYADIHGDMTIENIICTVNDGKPDFYIIDPNTGNLHNSPNLDFAKLLQSLHGNYEFLMKTNEVEIDENKITYLDSKTAVYDELYKNYKNYIFDKFGYDKAKSIFFHEIIHWLRLMPYKIEKNGKRAVLFYAGMIKVMNDVIEMFKDGDNNEK